MPPEDQLSLTSNPPSILLSSSRAGGRGRGRRLILYSTNVYWGPNKCPACSQVVKPRSLSLGGSDNAGSGTRKGREGPPGAAPTQTLQGTLLASPTSARVRTSYWRGRRAADGGKGGLTSVFLHTPPLIIIRGILATGCLGKRPRGASEK